MKSLLLLLRVGQLHLLLNGGEIVSRVKYKDGDEWKYLNVITSAGESGGVDLPDEAYVITDNCQYRFYYGGFGWYIRELGDKITTKDITNGQYMFYWCNTTDFKKLPDINLKSNTSVNIGNMFYHCDYLEKAPYVNGSITGLYNLFCNCQRLKEIPEDWVEHIDWSNYHGTGVIMRSGVFMECYSLKHIPQNLIDINYGNPTSASSSYTPYSQQFYRCYCLGEINNLPVQNPQTADYTSNLFDSTFSYCSRIKSITFATNPDGTPKTARWKNQLINLSVSIGYTINASNITGYNSGLTSTTRITNATTYATLKDNPDSWASDMSYSRYNKISAIETINSLPDTSATGTNTIRFLGSAGISTDGGAINTMSADEIAVATAKGWTVSFV